MKEKGFSKQERICNRDDFKRLFSEGKSFFAYPFRCVFYVSPAEELFVRMAVSVSKKKFKRAVDRNRVKRLMRESYRLEKHYLYNHLAQAPITFNMLLIYTGNTILDYKTIRHGMQGLMKKVRDAANGCCP